VTGWLFEDGYAKEAARYFQTAGNSFRTMLKKLPCRCMLKYQDKRGMLPEKNCTVLREAITPCGVSAVKRLFDASHRADERKLSYAPVFAPWK